MMRRSTIADRRSIAEQIGDDVRAGRISHAEGIRRARAAGAALARRDNARYTMRVVAVVIAVFVAVVLAAVFIPPSASGAPIAGLCVYCHPVPCLTAEFCGPGCACWKAEGESLGRCVGVESAPRGQAARR